MLRVRFALTFCSYAPLTHLHPRTDDIFIHLPGVAAHLRQSLRTVSEATQSSRPRIYWGAFEQYSFDARRHVPIGFNMDRPGRHCVAQSNATTSVFGPFPFAKGCVLSASGSPCPVLLHSSVIGLFSLGPLSYTRCRRVVIATPLHTRPPSRRPLYFVSASLIVELLASEWLLTDLNATLQSIEEEEEAAVAREMLLVSSPTKRRRRRRQHTPQPPPQQPQQPPQQPPQQSEPPPRQQQESPGNDQHRRKKTQKKTARVRVWEDVYTGYILTRLITGRGSPSGAAAAGGGGTSEAAGLALVEYGFGNGRPHPHYSDGYGQQLANSTLVWHMRTKKRTAYRVAFAHHWLVEQGRHCTPPPTSRWVRCGRNTERASTRSCAGARWLRCTSLLAAWSRPARIANNYTSRCSAELVELKHASKAWLQGIMTKEKTAR
jgi:hypothetical protein